MIATYLQFFATMVPDLVELLSFELPGIGVSFLAFILGITCTCVIIRALLLRVQIHGDFQGVSRRVEYRDAVDRQQSLFKD